MFFKKVYAWLRKLVGTSDSSFISDKKYSSSAKIVHKFDPQDHLNNDSYSIFPSENSFSSERHEAMREIEDRVFENSQDEIIQWEKEREPFD